MKFKRQFFVFAAAVLVVICSLSAGIVKAAAAPSLHASSDKASAVSQSDINISISLTGNPDISTLKMSLTYDSSILRYEGSTWSSSLSENDVKMASDTGSTVNLSVVSSSYYSEDGRIVTVCFKAVQNSDSIPVTLVLQEMTGIDMEHVSGCQVAGKISVPAAGNTEENTVEPDENDAENETGSSEENGADEEAGGQVSDIEESGDGEEDDILEDNTDIISSHKTQSDISEDAGSVSIVPSETGNKNLDASSRLSVSEQSVSSGSGSSKTDVSYKTGAGIGKDILLVLAVGCGILVLIIICRRETKQ